MPFIDDTLICWEVKTESSASERNPNLEFDLSSKAKVCRLSQRLTFALVQCEHPCCLARPNPFLLCLKNHHLLEVICMFRALLTLLCSTLAVFTLADERPNIVIIMADDLGWNGLGCYGSELAQTPCLDQLAAEGMRFTNAYACSQCLPTRAAIFSGQYGARTGLTSVETSSPDYAPMISPGRPKALEPEVYTLFEMLRDAGYKTGMSGKLHLGGPLNTNSALKNKNRGMEYLHDHGLQWAGTSMPNRNDKNVSAITDDIIRFIEENRDGPFIAYAAHHSPHMPLEVPPSSVQKAVDRGFKRSSNPRGLFSERVTADYVAMIEYLDGSIKRITDKLDELGIAENTLLLFLSDNGGLSRVWKNDPLRGGKGQLYEGGVRVPFIVRWPNKVKTGSTCTTPVHVVDLFPTLMDLVGVQPRKNQILDGLSLLPLLRQTGSFARDAVFSHHPEYVVGYAKTPCSMVRKGNYKLIHYFGDYLDPTDCVPGGAGVLYGRFILGSRTELYDLNQDPGETQNLANDMPDVTRELLADLQSWWSSTGARMPRPNPNMDRSKWKWNKND